MVIYKLINIKKYQLFALILLITIIYNFGCSLTNEIGLIKSTFS